MTDSGKQEKPRRAGKKQIMLSAETNLSDGGGYRAWCPELEISTSGPDRDEALERLKRAVLTFFEELEGETGRLN
jgi:predicted RNase H-like HicB family nuclease